MNLTILIGLIGLLSVASAVYTAVEAWRKKQISNSVDVVSSAVQLLKPYKQELAEVNQELAGARVKIRDLERDLIIAERKAERVTLQLDSARAEIKYLRSQVALLGDRVEEAKE